MKFLAEYGIHVDELGNVYKHNGERLPTHINAYGYYAARIKGRCQTIHPLILEAYVGKRPNSYDACHNNGDKLDNRLENLRWDSRHNNLLDRKTHGTDNAGDRHGRRKLSSNQVSNIRALYAAGFSQKSIAEVYKVHQGNISRIVNLRTWTV